MSKSVIYMANTDTQSVAVDGNINFGSPIRRYGKDISNVVGNPVLNTAGYYDVAVNVEFADTGAGTSTIALYADGAQVPGALAKTTTGTASTVHSVDFNAVVRVPCCKPVALTVKATGVAINVQNATITVIKL